MFKEIKKRGINSTLFINPAHIISFEVITSSFSGNGEKFVSAKVNQTDDPICFDYNSFMSQICTTTTTPTDGDIEEYFSQGTTKKLGV